MGHYHPYATSWLNAHPDKYGIAQRFRQRLEEQGHDGIVYGNEFEKHNDTADNHHVCAIPFREGQIDVTQRHSGPGCVDPESARRQWPGRSQPELPFGEHGAAVVAHFEDDSFHLPDGSALVEGRECPGCGQHVTRYKGAWWNGDDTPHDCDDFLGEDVHTAAVVAHFEDDDDDDFEDAYEPEEESYRRIRGEQDEHGYEWPMRRGMESGVEERVPDEPPRCLTCQEHGRGETWHWPEDGHAPGVQERVDRREQHERDLDEGRYDRTRYCDAACQRSHEEDQAHGISVHHTFAEGEPEHEEVRPREEMPQLSGPYDEPVGRPSGRYEVRSPSAEHRCHYCRNILPQYRRQGSLEVTAMAFEPPGHFDFYHGEGSDDGKPRTSELEEHLYGGHGNFNDRATEDAMRRGRDEAYAGSGTNSQKRARYHDVLEGLHQHEHDQALARAHQAVQHGADPGWPAELRNDLEGAHHQQWQDEWEERGRHQEEVREHLENGHAHMHGQDVSFDEMQAHLQNEHGVPSHGLPRHRLPDSDWNDPYQRDLEELHEQHHGDMGSYRHGEETGGEIQMHGQLVDSWDAEHHLVERHGYDINDLRRDEPDLEHEHAANHERDERYLSHPAWARMDEEGHLLDEDEDDLGSSDDAHEHRHVPYAAPPRSREELWQHLQEGHGVRQSADSTKEPGQSIMLKIHDSAHHGVEHYEGNANHQHDYPEGAGHDPVFGSKQGAALVSHFGERGPVQLDRAHDTVLAPAGPLEAAVQAARDLGAHEAQSAAEATATAREFGEVLAALRDGVRRAARLLEDLPLDPDVADGLHGMAASLNSMAAEAEEAARRLPPEASWEEPPASPNR
jgi:hypothetical protein